MPQYILRDVVVDFPFEAYECQLVYMEKVLESLQQGFHALLESPTGTGKTLCLLCATLAWMEANNLLQKEGVGANKNRGPPPRIIYASRTHSQLTQVIKELKRTKYKPKVAVLGSRQQLCIHEKVSTMAGTGQNSACRSLMKSKSCHHGNAVEVAKQSPDFEIHQREMLDIEELHSLGKKDKTCPFYLSREMAGDANIVFLPYNYLISPQIRETFKLDLANSILVFDEAHNLEASCGDAASYDLSSLDIAQCSYEIDQVLFAIKEGRISEEASKISIDQALTCKSMVHLIEDLLEETLVGKVNERIEKAEFLAKIFHKANIDQKTLPQLLETFDRIVSVLNQDEFGSGKGRAISHLHSFLRSYFRSLVGDQTQFYRVFIRREKTKHTPSSRLSWDSVAPDNVVKLGYWCFSPGVAMHDLKERKIRNIILTSGTLSPLSSFSAELRIDFRVQLENPHVISPEQIFVGVVCSGPSNRQLNASYHNRDDAGYINELGNSIVNFCRIVPDGVLVFFASYSAMARTLDHWQKKGPNVKMSVWDRIAQYKKPIVEPKQAGDFGAAMQDFYDKVTDATKTGAVFFAVCRGKVSEGLDFANSFGRAVVITGLPFPSFVDPKVRIKRDLLNEWKRSNRHLSDGTRGLDGSEWYQLQAARAVNQAMGRVIRHRHDYGAILLCEDRFASGASMSSLPLWLRNYAKVYRTFSDVVRDLSVFFKNIPSQNFYLDAQRLKEEARVAEEVALVNKELMVADGEGDSSECRQAFAPVLSRAPVDAPTLAMVPRTNDPTHIIDGYAVSEAPVQREKAAPPRSLKEGLGRYRFGASAAATAKEVRKAQVPAFSLSAKLGERRGSGGGDTGPPPATGGALVPISGTEDGGRRTPPAGGEGRSGASDEGQARELAVVAPPGEEEAVGKRPSRAALASAFLETAKRSLSKPEWATFKSILNDMKRNVSTNEKMPEHILTAIDRTCLLFAQGSRMELLYDFKALVPSRFHGVYDKKVADYVKNQGSQSSVEVTDVTDADVAPQSGEPGGGAAQTSAKGLPLERSAELVVGRTPNKSTDTFSSAKHDGGVKRPAHDSEKEPQPKRPKSSHVLLETEVPIGGGGVKSVPSYTPALSPRPDVFPSRAKCPICLDVPSAPSSSRCGHVCCAECWSQWLGTNLSCPVCKERVRVKQLTRLHL